MFVHTKGKPNQFRDDVVIGPDVHTHPPLHKLYFYFLNI